MNTLRALRHALRLSQTDLGALIGCSQPEISRMEAGTRKPSRKVLAALTLVEWLHETGEMGGLLEELRPQHYPD